MVMVAKSKKVQIRRMGSSRNSREAVVIAGKSQRQTRLRRPVSGFLLPHDNAGVHTRLLLRAGNGDRALCPSHLSPPPHHTIPP